MVRNETSRKAELDSIVKKYEGRPGAVLGILEEAQRTDPHRYLSEAVLRHISERAGIPLSSLYSVATFYSYFSLKPQGEHTIVVCRGTACHTRGSLVLLMEAAARLGAEDFREEEDASYTTPDMKFTIRTVACFGQCALAPVMSIDGCIYSSMTPGRLSSVIEQLKKAGKK
jgi:NADH-quinone oxidoreductase subunit E